MTQGSRHHYPMPAKWLVALAVGAVVLAVGLYFGLNVNNAGGGESTPTAAQSSSPSESAPVVMESPATGQVRDPVCGVVVDPLLSPYYHTTYAGGVFYFDTQECMDKFLADPKKYLPMPSTSPLVQATPGPGGELPSVTPGAGASPAETPSEVPVEEGTLPPPEETPTESLVPPAPVHTQAPRPSATKTPRPSPTARPTAPPATPTAAPTEETTPVEIVP